MSARPFNDTDLHAYVDDQTGPDRREAVAAFLKATPAEAARVELWRRQNDAVKSLFAATLTEPVPLWLTVGQIAVAPDKPPETTKPPTRIAGAVSPMRPVPNTRNRTVNAKVVAVLAFATGLAVPIVAARMPSLPGWLSSGTVDARQGFALRASEAHEVLGLEPDRALDVLDSPTGAVRTWLSHRLRFAVRIPNLSVQGWFLRGSRLASGNQGPGALLVYQRGVGERLTIYMAEVGDTWGQRIEALGDPGGVFVWSFETVGYAVMSTPDDGWLSRNAELLRDAIRAG